MNCLREGEMREPGKGRVNVVDNNNNNTSTIIISK